MKTLFKLTFTAWTVVASLSAFSAENEVSADNSGKNKRDDSVTEMTADNQSNNKMDVELARKIRAEIVSKKELSTYAKNIKIIVIGNQIILKGPVRSEREKGSVASVAHSLAPDHKVQNEIEIAKK